MERQYVAFETSGNRFCIDIMDVQEVAREQQITRMPDFPNFVEGIINLRGSVTPIVSIQKKIRSTMMSQNAPKSSIKKYMVVKTTGIVIGLMVDVLDKIITAADSQIQNAEGMGHDPSLVAGLLHVDGIVYLVLNVKGILAAEETAALEKLDQKFK